MATGELNKIVERLRTDLASEDVADSADGDLLNRYVRQRDEAAFEALVRRHGPMVMGVCRRILHNSHDAEDAFQATFLVLVRKAVTLRSPGMLGNWLYGVAYRTALAARKEAARRRVKEANVVPRTEPELTWDDLWPVLDQELERLPEKYRAVVVLCDLEGKTRKEAARDLSLPEGTVASRLAQARTMLAKRLARRGLAVSEGALLTVLSQHAAVSVSSAVVSSTIQVASLYAAGQAAGVISAKVAVLTEGVLNTMLFTKLKVVTVLLVATLSGAAGLICYTQAVESPPMQQNQEKRKPDPVVGQAREKRDAGPEVRQAEADVAAAEGEHLQARLGLQQAENKLEVAKRRLEILLKQLAEKQPPKAAVEPRAEPTPDQEVADLIEAYRALPPAAKVANEGDRILERLNRVQGKLSPRSQEAIARLRASQTLRSLMLAFQKNDQESLKNLIAKQSEREIFAERLAEIVPHVEPALRRWEYKILAESYVEKLGEGELAVGLGQLGEQGWELVGFQKDRLVFKREK
jgi:RNA polymerase sigma factor (sigma-70 family)